MKAKGQTTCYRYFFYRIVSQQSFSTLQMNCSNRLTKVQSVNSFENIFYNSLANPCCKYLLSCRPLTSGVEFNSIHHNFPISASLASFTQQEDHQSWVTDSSRDICRCRV